mmetsp:Transcript_13868/g.21872  ORF Transcript_13868/g.21872 Transcript_13868/m.21872 type:complete len:370 (-) Transcript_13868:188-1297(-)|eukprot:CAMPEP_0116997704 /NCGR_PEP_ID=MMETSP0472-20121206/1044_1 /TAXON_ID=693140 ORGANISM="Tiarina fusus, Strain LIS" /NCGR_SAMPLE_ID=MMETSP0472 /ASSEMBLY_ACC=CAM_ASM_000603 /LENGTH=369 /DNA_ID=CAMNT_0004696659 /DNA_START=225 /DNA_END=1334 /DNA_ORIENTATION=-
MALRARRSIGFGKFQSLVSIIVLVLQVALVGLAKANDRPYETSPILQWGCEFLARGDAVHTSENFEKAWGLCNRIRGGRLGRDASAATKANSTESEAAVLQANVEKDYSASPHSFPLFQENDGSQTDPDGIPTRYLKMQRNDRSRAKKSLESTIRWRKENDIDTILARPHAQFDVCKRVFPHYFCGRDDTNHVILLQRPGLIDLKAAELNGLTGEDLLYHYVFEMEYLWQILEPKADETMTSVIDLTGLNFSVLTKRELINVVQMFCRTMDAHFPQRAHKTLLINSPNWFGAIYKIISPLLRESTKEKIAILSKGRKQDEELRMLLSKSPMDNDQLLDGIAPSEMEKDLRDFVVARLADSGVEMQVVIE